MSDRDGREELADITRRLREVIAREGDGAELLLQSAKAARRERVAAGGAGAAPAAASAAAMVSENSPEPEADEPRLSLADTVITPIPRAPRSPDDVAPPIVDLFGVAEASKPVYEPLVFNAPVAPASAAAAIQPLPSHHDPLHPIESAARAEILSASLPVLGQVAGEIAECRKCGLCDTRTHTVPGVGSAATGIVFVGEAPGADEDAQGEPFVGRAGKLLTEIIKGMDERQLIPGVKLDRSTVYICNVLKCRPPENRNPLPHEIEQCSPYLHRQLEVLKPRIICCLGKFAAELLVGVKGTIRDMRGKVYRWKGSRLIVTYHPAAILRSPHQYRRPVWEDMQFLAREYMAD